MKEYADLKRNDRPSNVRFTALRMRMLTQVGALCEAAHCKEQATALHTTRGITKRFCPTHAAAAKVERSIRQQRETRQTMKRR
jgi:hypothetical protein